MQRRLKLTSYVMKRISTAFLQTVIVLIGIVALIILIWFPLTEGRATHLDLFSTYADPFILYGYGASMAFFVALYNAFRLLGYIGQNKVFSDFKEHKALYDLTKYFNRGGRTIYKVDP